MAINLVAAVLDRGPAKLAEMAVLLAIADSADKDSGEAWPSQATIARRARLTDRGVRKVLLALQAAGWITWEPRTRPNGSRTSNVYTVNLVKLGEARNHVPGVPGTTFRGGAEPRSGHGPEPRSAPEPSQKKEPSRARPSGRDAQAARSLPAGSERPARQPEEQGGEPSGETLSLALLFRSELADGRRVALRDRLIWPGSSEYLALQRALAAATAGKGFGEAERPRLGGS